MNKEIENINKAFSLSPEAITAGDRWLLENGIITDVTHNNIILNLYMNFPRAQYVEYFMDMEDKSIEIHLYFTKFWNWWYKNGKLLEKAKDLLVPYLGDFKISVKKELYVKHSQVSD
jgi:hypothetical protein